MGTFMGHVVPGTFFCCFGMWWLYNVFYRYFYAKRYRPTSYRNISSFPCHCRRNIPVESLVKVIAVAIGITGEFATGFENGHFTRIGNAQHITMYFFFGLNGVVDLLYYKKWDLPPKLDYISAVLGFGIEGFLFYHHLHGRSHMDVMVHMFLFYVIVMCIVSTLLEMHYAHSVLPSIARVFFTLLQGTWFFQVGFILYPPLGEPWDQEDHKQMMMVTVIFTWHIAALLGTMVGLGALIYSRVQNLQDSFASYQLVETKENPYKKDGHLNGHISPSSPSIHQILDSDSEDA